MAENETACLGLPLLQPAQAQKHVTVNEALTRLDALTNLVLERAEAVTPPGTVVDGQCWGVGANAVNGWEGKAGQIAMASNGGWVFAKPRPGQRAFLRDPGQSAIWDGAVWVGGALSVGGTGAGLIAGLAEAEVPTPSGTQISASLWVPEGAMVIGCSARVTEAITGTLTSWKLGTSADLGRFGQGLGIGKGSYARGILGQPTTYWTAEPLLLSATGGAFAGGKVRLSLHWLELRLPL